MKCLKSNKRNYFTEKQIVKKHYFRINGIKRKKQILSLHELFIAFLEKIIYEQKTACNFHDNFMTQIVYA